MTEVKSQYKSTTLSTENYLHLCDLYLQGSITKDQFFALAFGGNN